MYLAICICALLTIVTIYVVIKYEPSLILLILAWAVLFAILSGFATNVPTYTQAKWSTTIGNQRSPLSPTIMFTDYTIINGGEELYAPSHYFLKIDWINHWEYCEIPMTIDYPDGRALTYISARVPDNPYVKTGTIECK